jgi:hypothetical protein
LLDRRRIHRLAGESTVEINQMQIFEALHRKSFGLRRWIGVEDGGLIHVTAQKPDAFAAFEIDRGIENHGFQRKKFARRARPRA